MPKVIEQIMNNPVALAIAIAVLVLIIGLIVFLFVRSSRSKRANEAKIREELVAMERERQFASAADQVQFRRDPAEAAREVANIIREYLQISVLAIYAGREGEEELSNILPEQATTGPLDFSPSRSLPATVPALVMNEYKQPHVARLAAPQQEKSADTASLDQTGEEQTPEASSAVEGAQAETIAQSQNETSAVAPPAAQSADVLLVPWRGAFNWHGLIVTNTAQSASIESVTKYQEQIARLTDRLAIALELERERQELYALDERATRAANFSRALITSLDEAQPLAAIAREVTKLVAADSAALWRVEPGNSMVRMVAAYGLKSAEFLPLPVGQGLAGNIVTSNEPIMLEDAPSDPRCIFPREAKESGVVSYLGVPVTSDDQVVGVVEAHSTKHRSWTESDQRSLKSAASIIAEVLKSTDTRAGRLRVEGAYLGLSEALQRLRSPEEVMEAAVEVLGHALGVSRALVVELDGEGRPLPVRHEYRMSATSAQGASFKAGAFNQLSASGEPVAINDSRDGSLVDSEIQGALQILSELAVPVRVERQMKAVIYLNQCDRVRQWQQEEIEFADRVARQLALSLSSVHQLESALKDAQSAREDSRRATESAGRVQSLINSLPEIVIGLDPQGRLSFFNPAGRDRLGLKVEDLGRVAELLDPLATSDDAMWNRVLASDEAERFEAKLTRINAEAGGLPVSVAVTPVRNSKGEVTGHLVVISDLSHIGRDSQVAATRINEIEAQLREVESQLADARNAENQARQMLAKASAAEAKARAEADVLRRGETEARQELERAREDQARAHASSRQLLEINRLKSEFLVNAGREIESSLHSVLGFAELLMQGSYGELSGEQREAVENLYAWGRRMKGDVDALIEYGSTRSRRLEEGEGGQG